MKTRVCAALVAFAIMLAGCAETNVVRDAAQGVGLAGRPSESTDFVRASRPTSPSGYMPVGVSAPTRPDPRKTAAEFKALEAQLDAQKSQLEGQGAALRAAGSATQPPKPPSLPPPAPPTN